MYLRGLDEEPVQAATSDHATIPLFLRPYIFMLCKCNPCLLSFDRDYAHSPWILFQQYVLGSIASKPKVPMALPALTNLELAYDFFEAMADKSPRKSKFLESTTFIYSFASRELTVWLGWSWQAARAGAFGLKCNTESFDGSSETGTTEAHQDRGTCISLHEQNMSRFPYYPP